MAHRAGTGRVRCGARATGTTRRLSRPGCHRRSALPVHFFPAHGKDRGGDADSTARIFDLIRAIKDYSYMDQMPIQEVDIPQSLENTLAMVASRLRKVTVIRDYEPNLPCVSAYGRELNQVWTALIENALDAVQDKGEISSLCAPPAICCWSRSGTTVQAFP